MGGKAERSKGRTPTIRRRPHTSVPRRAPRHQRERCKVRGTRHPTCCLNGPRQGPAVRLMQRQRRERTAAGGAAGPARQCYSSLAAQMTKKDPSMGFGSTLAGDRKTRRGGLRFPVWHSSPPTPSRLSARRQSSSPLAKPLIPSPPVPVDPPYVGRVSQPPSIAAAPCASTVPSPSCGTASRARSPLALAAITCTASKSHPPQAMRAPTFPRTPVTFMP